MANVKAQAWVTSVVADLSVTGALVLAKSIRRSGTTRKLVAIVCSKVSKENRLLLQTQFDQLFLMDQNILSEVFAFSLVCFEKCLFIPSNCLLVENADELFSFQVKFETGARSKSKPEDFCLFAFAPNKQVYDALLEQDTGTFLTLVENLDTGVPMNVVPLNHFAKFLVDSGRILSDSLNAPIIQFVMADNRENIEERMRKLCEKDIGLYGKVIVETWLRFFDEKNEGSLPKNGYRNEPIAIVGMSCRYPGANNLEEFWKLLYAGEEGVREPPAFRWTTEHSLRVTAQDRKSKAGFLSVPVDEFDSKFFGVSPKEAQYIDPQARLLHEVLWESLEDAGINPHSLYGTHAGIFTGSWMHDYKDIAAGSAEKDFFRTYMGNSIGAAAARLSFLLGLTGPSIATESGCSSAIVALDLAVKSLRNGETNLALAGGVNLLLHPFTSDIMEYVISPNGRCKTFDANADGFARAEGCGVLVLKRLSDALRDRDNIRATIRGSAVAQEGLSRSLGTPTVHCEALVMRLALEDADVRPEQVSFVETHGTGTQVGDPMEVAAIAKAYYSPNRKEPLVIGSVKTNVGHTESCSGITGIMKSVLALQHELIPKHRNLETLNPEIFLDSIPALIPMENVPWPKIKGQSRICGVSSFGITGTDGHVILEEAPDTQLPKLSIGLERPTHLLTVSGKTSEALEELLATYQNRFSEKNESNADFASLAYSANVGRATFSHRAMLVANDYQDANEILINKSTLHGEVKEDFNGQICFLFTGQGSQYPGMAKMLYETSPIFRISFDACDRTLRENYNLSIREVFWNSDSSSKELSRTIYSQTSIFCVEYCLFKLWQSWGIHPDYVLGHSLGEFCAAVAAGVLTFEDALKLVAERSRLIDNLPRGSMLVIKASKREVEKWMKASKLDLDFAAVNYPEQTVVAGDTKTMEHFFAFLKGQGTKAIILEATHAFHSRHMDPILDSYRKVAQTIKFGKGNGRTQYVSGMEGRIIDDPSEIGADYWVRHTREKVNFVDACAALKESGCIDFIEVGPQPVLSSFVMSNIEDVPLNCLPSLRRGTNDWETILTSLGKLYLLGHKVDWKGYDEPYIRKKVSLPFHPFHRKSFWVECTSNKAPIIHPLLGSQLNNASALSIFQNDLMPKSVPYLTDHCIGSRVIFPGAGFTEMCLSAGYCVANGHTERLEPPTLTLRLENLRVDAPLELKEDKVCRFQVIVDLPDDTKDTSGFRVKVFHQNMIPGEESGKWILHASSNFVPVASTKDCMKLWNPARIPEIISQVKPTQTESFYKRADEAGLKFGENFRMLRRYWAIKQENCQTDCDEIVAEMELPKDWNKYLLHPLIIDAVFQTGILTGERYYTSKLKVPVFIGGLTLFPGLNTVEPEGTSLYLHVWKEQEKPLLFVSTSKGMPVAFGEDLEFLDTTVRTIESVLEQQCSAVPDSWEEVWKILPSPLNGQVASVENPNGVLSDPSFLQTTTAIRHNTPEDVELHLKNMRLIFLYILNAFQELGWQPEVGQQLSVTSFCKALGVQAEFEKLVRFYFTVFEEDAGLLKYSGDDQWKVVALPPENLKVVEEMKGLTKELKNTNLFSPVTIIHENIAKNLKEILTGLQSALSLLFPTDESLYKYSADAYYQCHPSRGKLFQLTRTVMKQVFSQSEVQDKLVNGGKGVYRVLEVGGGTGSMSGPLLALLRDVWGDRFEMYYTDISQAFFIKAEQKFEEYRENIKFQVFNVEQSPLSQGIPLGYFDMVCATDVLHATRDLEESLVHLRQTLRPGGVICFTETMVPARDLTFVFGLLEGYWRYEDFDLRPHHCCGRDQMWRSALLQSGFESYRSFKTFVDQFACLTAVAARNVEVDSLVPSRVLGESVQKSAPTWVIFADRNNFEVVAKVANSLVASGNKVVVAVKTGGSQVPRNLLRKEVAMQTVEGGKVEEDASPYESLLNGDTLQGVIYAWGMNLKETDQKSVALPFLHIVKTLVALPKLPKLFVVTQGVYAVTEDAASNNPTPATLIGMVKSLKNEYFDMLVRYVDLEQGSSVKEQVSQVLFELAMYKGAKEQHRVQVAYRGGLRQEPRLGKGQVVKPTDELKLPPSTDKFHLKLPASRMIQDLEFEPLEVESVGETEIEVKIKAFALNFRDIFTIIKPSAEFENLNAVGLDFAGVVTKAGPKAKWKVGDRVFGCYYKDEQLPSHYVLDSRAVTEIPENMTYWGAATMPAVFSTAYHCLINVARMKKGDRVLIHTGSGGVGLAAIQLAHLVGAEVITTAGNPRKRAYLRSLGVEHVFKSRDTSYEQDILRVTKGQGVDIVLNSITGPGIKEATLRATAKNGRFVEMSKLTIWTPEEVKALRPDVEYTIVDLTTVDEEVHVDLLKRMHQYLSTGQLKAIPFVKFDALRIRQALQYFQKAKHIGKVVVTMPEVSTSQGQYMTEVPLFNSQSTYLITGGLGGIGFEVCKWMLSKGATDIVLNGRNHSKPEVTEQINKLNEKGHNVMVRLGDVGNYDHCNSLTDEITGSMKPLRGIMHCAGVLRDNVYPNQTWDTFNATFTPKVQGTWNLHELTKNLPLEHFVVYSSITALVGTPGQANHAAANCFEDAFIHYRHSLGLPGLTINWGQWAQVGCAKEVNVLSLMPVSVQRMLNGMETALRTEKKQTSFVDFASLKNILTSVPLSKYYFDERTLRQYESMEVQSDQELKANKFWEEMDKAVTYDEKVTVLSSYLKIILGTALRMGQDEKLSDTADLQELGVDSLMMIELKNSIQTLLGSRVNVTANMLKNCNTIQLISEAVVRKLLEKDEGEEADIPLEPLPPAELLQLLTDDARLPEVVQVAPETRPPGKPSQFRTLLVTGATGQLAPYLLRELCNGYKFVGKIYCLVRGAPEDNAALTMVKDHLKALGLEEQVNWEKIEGVVGNVVQNNLGMEAEKYAELCKTVHAVIHCAAKMHLTEHLRPSSETGSGTDCRSVNILGTLNILKFACAVQAKPVFYPSSLLCGVPREAGDNPLTDHWPDNSAIHAILHNKYPGLQSAKWICEMLLDQANQRGIPCKVFRFPWFAGESQTGRADVVKNVFLLKFLSFLKLGAMPDIVVPATGLPVDICAKMSLQLFMNDEAPNEIYNVAHNRPKWEHEFLEVAKQEFGKQLEIVPCEAFVQKLEEDNSEVEGMKNLFRDLKMISRYFAEASEFLVSHVTCLETYFTSPRVVHFIPNYGEDFPSTMETISRGLKYVKGTGMLEKFGI